jgi:hypothetical protein
MKFPVERIYNLVHFADGVSFYLGYAFSGLEL